MELDDKERIRIFKDYLTSPKDGLSLTDSEADKVIEKTIYPESMAYTYAEIESIPNNGLRFPIDFIEFYDPITKEKFYFEKDSIEQDPLIRKFYGKKEIKESALPTGNVMEITFTGNSGKSYTEDISHEMLYIITAGVKVPENTTNIRFSLNDLYLRCYSNQSDLVKVPLTPFQQGELETAVKDGMYSPTTKEIDKHFTPQDDEVYVTDLVSGKIYYGLIDSPYSKDFSEWIDSGWSLLD